MTSYPEGLVRAVPSPLAVLIEEGTIICRRQGGWLGLFMLVMIGYGLVPSYVTPEGGAPYLFYAGRPGLAGSFVFLSLALIWGLSVWKDLPRGSRAHQLTLPLGRVGRMAYRTAAGAVLLIAGVTISLAVGGLGCMLLEPGTGYFSAELGFRVTGMFWTPLGLLNAYLLATLAALRFRRPDHVVLWGLFGLIAASILLALIENPLVLRAINTAVAPLFTGMGLWGPTPVSVAAMEPSRTLSILILAVLLMVTVPLTMLRTREG